MKEIHLFYSPDIEETLSLPDEEAAHAIRVLRMGVGDEIKVTDGRGKLFSANIVSCNKKSCQIEINERTEVEPSWYSGVHLAIAPTKMMDRMEWMTEKCTEIGFDSLTFLDSTNSDRRVIKTERINKTAISAMKQSHKAFKPEIHDITAFKSFINQQFDGEKFIAHCYGNGSGSLISEGGSTPSPFLYDVVSPDVPSLVLIGPEGDFTLEEVELANKAGFRSVSLGESRLRTETAGVAAVFMMWMKKRISQ